MSHPVSVRDLPMGNYILSVTTRHNGESAAIMEELTCRTVKAWYMIVTRFLEKEVYTLPLADDGQLRGSVESAYAYEINTNPDTDRPDQPLFEFAETFGDARVTVWDTFKSNPRISFHLNSDDIPQHAVDTWLANQRGSARAIEELKIDSAVQTETAQPAPANQAPATPKGNARQQSSNNWPPAQQAATSANGVAPLMTKRDAIAKLQPGNPFRMKVVQIERHSKDGNDYYDFFEPMSSGKAGQYSSKKIYADNEIALNNGLIAYIETLGVQLGQALTGNWIVNCTLGKPKTQTIKGEEKTYTDIYINSFEGQPEPV